MTDIGPAHDTIARQTSLTGLRILLVEDSWIVAQSLKSIFDKLDAVVVGPAATLDEATALANTEAFDIAVVDMNLQGEMADKLVCAVRWRGIPVILVTGSEIRPEIAAKVMAVMQKPIRVEALLGKVREARAAMPAAAVH